MSALFAAAALLTPVLALIAVTPDPVALHLGPIPVYWYGLCYAVGLFLTYRVVTGEAHRRGLNAMLVDTGIIVVGIAALIGGRLYHVIDQWARYKDDLLTAILPLARAADGSLQFAGFTGLGVYGGILTGTIAAALVIRRWKQPFWRWADVIAPGLFTMQAIGRWGNFFNQELYGPPTDLPWGIAIDCAHRVVPYGCDAYPAATTAFQPLFLYESLSGALGTIALLWLARRYGRHMRPGDLLLIFFIWYAVVRFALETLRTGNWTVGGIPTAMLVSVVLIAGSLAVLAWRHRPGGTGDRWGEAPASEETGDEEWVEVDEDDVEDSAVADESAAAPADAPAAVGPGDAPAEPGDDAAAGVTDLVAAAAPGGTDAAPADVTADPNPGDSEPA